MPQTRIPDRKGTVAGALLAGLLLIACPAVPAAEFTFHNYSYENGIPREQVQALTQDGEGYLWLATTSGLIRYDGREFTTYTTRDGLSTNSISHLHTDADGTLLIGTWGGGVCFRRPRGFDCVQSETESGSDIVHDIVTRNGRIWLGTENGLLMIEAGSRTSRQPVPAAELPSPRVLSLAAAADGGLWIGTARGLSRWDTHNGHRPVPAPFGAAPVSALLTLGKDLYVAAGSGVYRRDGENWHRLPVPGKFGAGGILDLASGPGGTLWATGSRGVLHINSEGTVLITEADGLPANRVYQAYATRDGLLWFATDAGLSKLMPALFRVITGEHGLQNTFIRSVAETRDGSVWLGTKSGIHRYRDGTVRRLSLDPRIDDDKIYSLQPAPEGGMLIGTRAGLFHWRDDGLRQYTTDDGLPSDYIAAMTPRAAGGIWLGTRDGLAWWQDAAIHSVNEPSLHGIFILSMDEGATGRLWLGRDHDGVLLREPDGTVRSFDRGNGLSDETVWDVYATREGGAWIGTNGDGAFHIDPHGNITRIGREQGLSSGFVWQVLRDRNGSVWFYTSRGLDCLRDGRIINYGRSYGLAGREGSTGAVLEHGSGRLFFGTNDGLVIHNPMLRDRERIETATIIQGVSSSGQAAVAPGTRLPHDVRNLEFRFTAPVFRRVQALEFRHRLVGLHDEWSAPTTDNTVVYGGLPPGRYVFEVSAHLAGEPWQQPPTRFAFSVRTPHWQRWWFWVAASLLALGLVTVLYLIRMRSLQSIRRRLEAEVGARTRALEASNRELRRLSITDELTGLHNRRSFMQTLERELDRMQRAPDGSWLTVMLADLDYFKEVNDRYGHVAGDHVLRECALRLAAALRTTDVVARYGGEEFAVMLPFTNPEGAEQAARKILSAFSAKPFSAGENQSVGLTISIGIGLLQTRHADKGQSPGLESLLQSADQALYKAKQGGRNSFEIAAPLYCHTGEHLRT